MDTTNTKQKKLAFPQSNKSIFKGFGPAFLAIALAIGSGELILWPYLSAHYGFGILWGALLGIGLQLILIVALERNAAFFGENALATFSRIWRYAIPWIIFSTIIGFGWPAFPAMISQMLIQAFHLSVSQVLLSVIILAIATLIVTVGTGVYQRILRFQKWNMSFLFLLITFLFLFFLIQHPEYLTKLGLGLIGYGEGYRFIPLGISLSLFLGAIAYAGSGGNLLLMNSFYVVEEGKGLVPKRHSSSEELIPDETEDSIRAAKSFLRFSWKQNTIFFFLFGLVLIIMLSFISYAALYGMEGLSHDFTFLVQEANVFREKIHPLVGILFIISSALALFGVQLGIFDFIGRMSEEAEKHRKKGSTHRFRFGYKTAVLIMTAFGFLIFALGISKPKELLILGSVLNAFSMGVIAIFLTIVEYRLVPPYLKSRFFRTVLPLIAVFYILFFFYVLIQQFS